MNFKKLIITFIILISVTIPCYAEELYYPSSCLEYFNYEIPEYYSYSISSLFLSQRIQYKYNKEYDLKIINNHINFYANKKNEAENLKYYAELLGYSVEHPLIIFAEAEINHFDYLTNKYKLDYNIWTERIEKYPVASKIWIYLKHLGYNDYVCAGILGNIMTETGGNSFDIQYWLFDNKIHYGMCQWNIDYYKDINNTDLDFQLEFLKESIKKEFNTFGHVYIEGFKYEHFINLTNYNDTALAFAKVYERCSSNSYEIRQKNAKLAFDYFH